MTLKETVGMMAEIDVVTEGHCGWRRVFQTTSWLAEEFPALFWVAESLRPYDTGTDGGLAGGTS